MMTRAIDERPAERGTTDRAVDQHLPPPPLPPLPPPPFGPPPFVPPGGIFVPAGFGDAPAAPFPFANSRPSLIVVVRFDPAVLTTIIRLRKSFDRKLVAMCEHPGRRYVAVAHAGLR
jgi:hypothetical protein